MQMSLRPGIMRPSAADSERKISNVPDFLSFISTHVYSVLLKVLPIRNALPTLPGLLNILSSPATSVTLEHTLITIGGWESHLLAIRHF